VAVAQARKRIESDAKVSRDRPREKPQRIADEIRRLIVSGKFAEGDLLGREPELVERFGVSRPSLREALRILEAEGLISVMRGMHGGVVVHEPDERMTARTAALVLQARNVSLADVYEARTLLEPTAVRIVASSRARRGAAEELRQLIKEQLRVIRDDAFGRTNARFHDRLVALAGNQTLTIIAEMLNEVVARAVMAINKTGVSASTATGRRQAIRTQERLVSLIDAGKAAQAEELWRAHMTVVARILMGRRAARTVIDLMNHH
jgi:GntR family transcriptional regulator, transcriptional repressor for pyruvate dehydrogenase complex